MCLDMSIQGRLKQIDEGFDDGVYYDAGRCDVCEGERRHYFHKYVPSYIVEVCSNCLTGFERYNFPKEGDIGVCPFCEKIVRYDIGDIDENSYISCNGEDCDHKTHLSCFLENFAYEDFEDDADVLQLFKVWYCNEHFNMHDIRAEIEGLADNDMTRLYRALLAKRIQYIYHVNTVRTACTFLEIGGLLSRQGVELAGVDQTPQLSDIEDQQLGIWNDIFFDSFDIHAYLNQCNNKREGINEYGPVLFKFRIECLLDPELLSKLKITRSNPVRWIRENEGQQNFFDNIEEVEDSFRINNFDQHLVIHDCNLVFSFEYLEEIIVDDPNLMDIDGVDYYSQAVGALKRSARKSNNQNIRITRRLCDDGCICRETYIQMNDCEKGKFNSRYLP